MQRFWWPGYETQLLEQLQRQQNSTQFCDTLLQTEGISVPAHSCVLAALSPYLSQRLSAAPSPPAGQKRRLPLQAVTAHTLLKLVGLLYSGELEVKSSEERRDVLAAAHRFGLADLVVGCGDGGGRGAAPPDRRQRVHVGDVKTQDAQVQAEARGRTDGDRLRRKSLVSVGTQTGSGGLTCAAGPAPPSHQTTPPGGASSVAGCSSSPPQNGTQSSLSPYPAVRSDPESTAEPSSSSSSSTATAPTSLSGAGPPGAHQTNISRPSSEAAADGGTSDQLRGAGRESMLGKGGGGGGGGGEEKEERSCCVRRRGKNLERMKRTEQMTGTEPVSVKVKLRRRTKGEAWEIVDGQEADETVPASLEQSRSDLKTPPTGIEGVQNLPVRDPEHQTVQPVFTSSCRPPEHAHPGSYSEASSNGRLSACQSNELESEGLCSPRGALEESDEQIDKLLEDIMMSLNILPDPDRNCKKAQMNHDGVAAFCQAAAAGNGAGPPHAGVGAAGCVFYQDLEAQRGLSSKDSGIHCSFGAQNRPSYVAPSTLQIDLLTQQQQQQQQRSEFSSPIQPFRPIVGLSRPGEENSPYPQAAGSMLPVSCLSGRKKLHCMASQQQSSLEDQNGEFLALQHGSESDSPGAFHPPFADASRLPRCLSPLEPGPSAAQPRPHPSASVQPKGYVRPSLQTRSRLPKASRTRKSSSQLLEASSAERSRRREKLPAKTGGEAGFTKRGRKSKPKWKPDPRKRKRSTRGATEDARPPKRRKLPESQKGSEGLVLDSSGVRDAASPLGSPCSDVPMKERKESCGAASQTRIRTRSFVKKYQLNGINTISDNCCVLIPVLRRAAVAQKRDPAAPKRKRGRPRKIKMEEAPPERVSTNGEAGGRKEEEKAEQEFHMGRGLLSGARDGEERATSAEDSGKNAADNAKSGETQKQSWMVTLKEFQKFIKQKHSNTRKATAVQDPNVDVGGLEKATVREAAEEEEAEADKSDGVKAQPQLRLDAPLDENHNLLPAPSAAPPKPARLEETGEKVASAHGNKAASEEEEEAMLSPQRAQPATGPDQGADGSSTLSGCGEEADDEVEVDVMLYSPGKGSSTRASEGRVAVLPDEEEEEEEDANEIDVTGDEEE
ncbi:uncharacterized protein LOC105931456 isoform X2 [Fundulus heteroclitus]|uniref:uncharacterized protein LOC105931456 isoform X2 n=1 Tax=Fundulus heteroclitus TaxID=8078 RepID=UPI00165C1EC0|nr:uncharacterized protein LOC105931456 isoform X2 [Fundulus heteroclitus]